MVKGVPQHYNCALLRYTRSPNVWIAYDQDEVVNGRHKKHANGVFIRDPRNGFTRDRARHPSHPSAAFPILRPKPLFGHVAARRLKVSRRHNVIPVVRTWPLFVAYDHRRRRYYIIIVFYMPRVSFQNG